MLERGSSDLMRYWSIPLMAFSGLLVGTGATGCRPAHELKVAKVSGTVICNGEPLKTGGLVIFIPKAKAGQGVQDSGKAASGVVMPDGSYSLTTYTTDDGAVVGEHSVQVFAPPLEDDDAPITDANRFACGNATLQKTVEDSNNWIDLELTFEPAKK